MSISKIQCIFRHFCLDVDVSTPAAKPSMPRGLRQKDALARRLFHEFNSSVFGNQVECILC